MNKTVLVVEDEYLIAMDLQLLLEGNGWRVIGPVATVREALALLEIETPRVALLDINLGDELVTPVAVALRASGIPFAVASAYADPERYAGPVMAGIPNAGKPPNERKVLGTLDLLIDLAPG